MKLLPENPKKRKIALTVGGIAIALFAFGFFYITYLSPAGSSGQGSPADSGGPKIKGVSDDMIRKLQGDVAGIQDELDNDFYKNLKSYSWPGMSGDTTPAGNASPFLAPSSQ